MAEKGPASHEAKASLLSQEGRRACQALAAQKNGLSSRRAAGLLAMDGGATQRKAAEESGLTLGQIRYLLTIFRRKGMAILLTETASTPSSPVAADQPGAGTSSEIRVEEAAGKKKNKTKAKNEKGKSKGENKRREKKAKEKKAKEKKAKDKKKKKDKGKKAK